MRISLFLRISKRADARSLSGASVTSESRPNGLALYKFVSSCPIISSAGLNSRTAFLVKTQQRCIYARLAKAPWRALQLLPLCAGQNAEILLRVCQSVPPVIPIHNATKRPSRKEFNHDRDRTVQRSRAKVMGQRFASGPLGSVRARSPGEIGACVDFFPGQFRREL